MNSYKDVLKGLHNTVPRLTVVHSRWFVVNENTRCLIKLSQPNSFDSYMDIVARVTLFFDNKIIMDALITYNTDLDKLFEKLDRKIKERTGNHNE